MSFVCARCSKTFDKATYLKLHLENQEHTCDFMCMKCGEKQDNKRKYMRHIKNNNCIMKKPKNINNNNDNNENDKKNDEKNDVNSNDNNNGVSHTKPYKYKATLKFEISNICLDYIEFYGIVSYGLKYDDFFNKIKKDIHDLFESNLNGNIGKVTTRTSYLDQQLINLIELFYSNFEYPNLMNIINTDDKKYWIYTGHKFTPDILSKEWRYKYMLYIIIKYLKKYSKTITSDEDKHIQNYISIYVIPHIIIQSCEIRFIGIFDIFLKRNELILKTLNYTRFPKMYMLTENDYQNQMLFLEKKLPKIMETYNTIVKKKFIRQQELFDLAKLDRNFTKFE